MRINPFKVYCLGEMRNLYKILVGEPQEKRPFGRPLNWLQIGSNAQLL